MGLVSSIRAVFGLSGASAVTAEGDLGWSGDVDDPIVTAAGYPVSARTVMRLALVVTCANKIAKSVGSLPLKIYERRADGTKAEAADHPLSDLLRYAPNAEQTALEFRTAMTWDLAFWRGAYAEIVPGDRGAVDQLRHLPAGDVKPRRVRGELWFEAPGRDGMGRRMLHHSEVFRVQLPPYREDGITPKPIFELGRETFSKALALQEYANSYFQNNGGAGDWISMKDGWFANDEERDNFLDWIRKKTSPRRRHETKIVPFGATITKGGVKNNEAQFLETWQATAREIIALFDIPPHKVGDLEKATFSNIEQQALEFVQDTLLVYLEAWEQAVRRDLIIAKGRFYAEHVLAALLRGDLGARYAAYAIGRQWGWLSVNDILRRENLNPIGPAGDIYLTPMNMGEAGQGEQGASPGVRALVSALDGCDPDQLAAALKSIKLEQGVDDVD
ncbi:MAG: phage portal protein [Oceanicaulis sp.]